MIMINEKNDYFFLFSQFFILAEAKLLSSLLHSCSIYLLFDILLIVGLQFYYCTASDCKLIFALLNQNSICTQEEAPLWQNPSYISLLFPIFFLINKKIFLQNNKLFTLINNLLLEASKNEVCQAQSHQRMSWTYGDVSNNM